MIANNSAQISFDRTRNADSVYAKYKRFPKGEKRTKTKRNNICGAWIGCSGYYNVHVVESEGVVTIGEERTSGNLKVKNSTGERYNQKKMSDSEAG